MPHERHQSSIKNITTLLILTDSVPSVQSLLALIFPPKYLLIHYTSPGVPSFTIPHISESSTPTPDRTCRPPDRPTASNPANVAAAAMRLFKAGALIALAFIPLACAEEDEVRTIGSHPPRAPADARCAMHPICATMQTSNF